MEQNLNFVNSKFLHKELNVVCGVNENNTCRICLENNRDNSKMCNIFEGAEPLSCIIMLCATVQVLNGDGLPNSICQKCLVKLNIAWHFKLQCESSDIKLRGLFSAAVLHLGDDSNIHNLNKKELQNSFTEQGYANEHISNKSIAHTKIKQSTKLDNRNIISVKEIRKHQCDTCGKVFNRREYLTQHIRIHTGEKPYHCHLCEKRFINSGHLTTHMRTHTGEKPHLCTMCPKAFSTRQELRKHTMVHKGERPFICSTCGKRFGSSSNLYSHLKHHTGEKNFTCEICGKAFYTKQELKQHIVIHTGEKAFQCEFCNKRFSQVAHLRRHSKLHINTLKATDVIK